MKNVELSGRNGVNHRVIYLDLIRVIGCLMVVLTHVTAKMMDFPVKSAIWPLANILNGCTRAAVPLFLMISGALFLNPNKNITIQKIIKKYVPKLGVTLILWNCIYALIEWAITRNLAITLHTLILGAFHLWFLYVTIGCYLVAPLLRPIVTNMKLMWWALGLGGLFTVLPVTIQEFLRPDNVLLSLIHAFQVNLMSGFVFYFVLGYALTQLSINTAKMWLAGVGAFIGTVVIIIGTESQSIVAGHLNQAFQANVNLWIMLQASGLFLIIRGLKLTKLSKTLKLISELSLPIYLVHPIFLGAILKLHLLKPDALHLLVAYVLVFMGATVFAWCYQGILRWLRSYFRPTVTRQYSQD